MWRVLVGALIFGLVIASVVATPPIPLRPPGFIYNATVEAPVVLEAFVDLVCPDSKNAWLTYQEVSDYYGSDKVRFSALLFPLPYHRAAMMAAQGGFVANDLDPELTYTWFNKVFEEQAALYDDTIFDQDNWFIWETLAAWAAEVGYDQDEFSLRLARTDEAHSTTRTHFKYGASRGVFGTPQTYVNGALVDSETTWTLDDWKAVIDPLIEENGGHGSANALGLNIAVILLGIIMNMLWC